MGMLKAKTAIKYSKVILVSKENHIEETIFGFVDIV